jgi:dipeptidyl aminopeptidase/acylaminoacyl peptidase
MPNDRYVRSVMEGNNYGDLYLLNIESGNIERLTNNKMIAESKLTFAPDGQTIAFGASDDFVYFRSYKVYTRPIAAINGPWKKLGGGYDGDVGIDWWSDDSKTIYFNDGVKATTQVMALDVATNTVKPVTDFRASTFAFRDDDSKKIVVSYSDPKTPTVHFVVDDAGQIANKAAWHQVTDANPQAKQFALGEEEETCWKSTDGKTTCGILIKPVGYQPGQRYPLVVAIHGGPQSADVLGFNGGYGGQIYAGDGYAVLMPNYRGSTNYGEAHKWGIVNDYLRRGTTTS